MSYVPAADVALTGQDAILQGATYYREFALTVSSVAVDLSDWVGANKGVRCQFRDDSNGATVAATPTMTIVSPATDGKIGIALSSTVTTAMGSITSGVFDVELYDTNVTPPTVERVISGTWALDLEVTR